MNILRHLTTAEMTLLKSLRNQHEFFEHKNRKLPKDSFHFLFHPYGRKRLLFSGQNLVLNQTAVSKELIISAASCLFKEKTYFQVWKCIYLS